MSGHSSGPGHETQDFTFKVGIWMVPASMLALATYVLICYMWGSSALTAEMRRKEAMGAEATVVTLHAFRAQEDTILTTYRVKDKAAGRVQIPVERAIQILAERAASHSSAAH